MYNICHINIIAILDIILIAKVYDVTKNNKQLIIHKFNIKIMQVCNIKNVLQMYN